MTVCISASCKDRNQRCIVLCTDWQVSSALGSAQTKLKQHFLRFPWTCLASGTEPDILAALRLLKKHFIAAKTIDETNVPELVRAALNERKKEKTNEFVHGQYGISYEDFLSFGKDKLPTDLHREAAMSIADITLGASFIVVGISDNDIVMLETTDKCRVHIREDFATIGEGAYLAQSALLQRECIETMKMEEAIYCVYEAKRYAERVKSVGDITYISIIDSDGGLRVVSDNGMNFLSNLFDKFGPQPFGDVKLKRFLEKC